jgi:predicted transcriptional regulator
VEEGVKKTEKTGESLQEIIRMNDRVRDMINQIATTTAEQSATSTEVSQNVSEIARLAEESSQGALQSAKACDGLSAMAADLEQIFGQFTLRQSSRNRPQLSASRSTVSGSPAAAREEPMSRRAAAGKAH